MLIVGIDPGISGAIAAVTPSGRGPGYDVWKRAMEEMRTKHQQRSRPRVEREPGEDFEELFEQ